MQTYKRPVILILLLFLLCGCKAGARAENIPAAAPVPTASPTAVPTASPSPTPEPTPTPTPEPAFEEVLLSGMSLEEKVAQLFFVRCPDTDAETMISALQPGGLLLFGRDFEGLTREEVTEKIASYQKNAKLPLLIGTDEEGGTVVRVSQNKALSETRFPSPRDLYAAGGPERLLEVEKEKCALLKSLGIQVNFAPVCDLSDDPAGFMYPRSLGLSAEDTAKAIGEIVKLCEAEKVGCVLKHFPGYGNADDTHVGIVYDDRPLETFRTADFLPFTAGMEAGADCIMAAHNIVSCVDAEKPASLSPAWYALLRDELRFSGVIITDDLVMDAITEFTDSSSAAVDAVLAGCDMLCSSEFEVQYTAVLEAVKAGEIAESRIDESVLRILCWKKELGLIG